MLQKSLFASLGSAFKYQLAVIGLILAVTPGPRAQSNVNRAASSVDVLSPKVTGVSGQLAIGREITVEVQELSAWSANHDPQRVVLFLNGRALKGLYPEQVDLPANKLLFHIRRTPEASVVWNDLFHEPVLSRRVSLSVGLVDAGPFETVFEDDRQVTLTVIPKVAAIVSVAVLFGLLIIFVYLARTTNLIRSLGEGSEVGVRRPYELGRVQMSFWLLIIAISYFYLWLVTGDLYTIAPSHLALTGISGATAVGASVVGRRKAVSQGFLTDILSGTYGYRFHCFQSCAWTIVLGLIFVATVYDDLVMPDFSATLLALTGMSAGTYLSFAFLEERQTPDLETRRSR
jgi:hypothetical protein